MFGHTLATEFINWAEARLKIARMTLTIKRDGNWSSFQLANSALPLSVTSSAIAPSARMPCLAGAPARTPPTLHALVLQKQGRGGGENSTWQVRASGHEAPCMPCTAKASAAQHCRWQPDATRRCWPQARKGQGKANPWTETDELFICLFVITANCYP